MCHAISGDNLCRCQSWKNKVRVVFWHGVCLPCCFLLNLSLGSIRTGLSKANQMRVHNSGFQCSFSEQGTTSLGFRGVWCHGKYSQNGQRGWFAHLVSRETRKKLSSGASIQLGRLLRSIRPLPRTWEAPVLLPLCCWNRERDGHLEIFPSRKRVTDYMPSEDLGFHFYSEHKHLVDA